MSRIGLVQMTSTEDYAANLAHALESLGEAAGEGAELVAYPEIFLYLGGRRGKLAHAQSLDGEAVSRFRDEAARRGLWILLGSIHERIPERDDKVYNTAVLIDPRGEVAATYRKRNLFDVELPHLRLMESDTIEPGRGAPPVVDTVLGRTGVTICFDLRFPGLYRQLRAAGAQVILVPSNFTHPTGAAHWEPLLRARAIENQCYVAAPAQVGRHNSRYTSYGHSALVDPWGTVTALAPERPGVTVGKVDPAYVNEVRHHLPCVGEG